jgi:hypothetical protein
MQVTITALKDTERTSQRTGKPFTSRGIKTAEHGEKWLSGFAGKDNASWKVGDTVEIEVEQKGEYLNFSTPKGSFQKGGTSGDLNRVEMKIDALKAELYTMGAALTGMRGVLGDILSKVDPAIKSDDPF